MSNTDKPWWEEPPKLGNGIFDRIKDINTQPVKLLTWKELDKLMLKKAKLARKQTIEYEKQAKDNARHLAKRSKDLGKDPPIELVFIALSVPPMMVGSDFMKRYKEWLT